MCVVGRSRSIDKPDAFVWLRQFEGMEARATELETFYCGPTWQRHGGQANASMRNFDKVLLLRAWQTEENPPLWHYTVLSRLDCLVAESSL